MEFRKDINGLRAIAVIAVVCFHFNPVWLPGGFSGVDVFFVISGFLMTGIIFKELEKENPIPGKNFLFSFYKARAKRIIPAMAVMCLILLVLGYLFLIPLDYKELGKHVASSVTFLSNIVYWQEAGYFDAASHEKWLLHTWSLSVEWQFYILYPLILIALRKLFSINLVKISILLGAVFGFAFSAIATYKWADAAYFLFPTRAWEMLLGGVAFLYPIKFNEKNKRFFEWLGLILILSSFFFVSGSTPWPGYWAAFPVLGAFIVIQVNRSDSCFTNNYFFQKIGLWSYSIYLWHWVVIVANAKFDLGVGILTYFFIALVLGFLSYRFIEKNGFFLTLSFCLTLFFAILVAENGLNFRVDSKFQLDRADFHQKYYGGSGYPANRLFYINSSDADFDFVFVGDSYGLQYAKALDENNYRVAGLFDHGCLIFPNITRYLKNREDENCSAEYDKLKSVLQGNSIPLIIAHSWDGYGNVIIEKGGDKPLRLEKNDYYELIRKELDVIVSENGANRFYFVLGVPQRAKYNAFECLAGTQLIGYRLFKKCAEQQEQKDLEINSMLNTWASMHENAYFIDPNEFLCADRKCLVISRGEPVHSDGSHLSVFGAPLVVDGMFNFIHATIAGN